MNNKPTISAVIIAKNEENVIKACLETVIWCDEIILIDNGSTDKTHQIAENYGAKVVSFSHKSFSRLRNEALKYVKTDWVFYIDADERVTRKLSNEIIVNLSTEDNISALSFFRKNICYGKEFSFGGWEADLVTRAFKTKSFKRWTGDIHESPNYSGDCIQLKTFLIHHTHRNTSDGLRKTIEWTKMEAKLLADSNISAVSFLTIIRKGFMEFLRRGIIKKGYKDGLPGMIEALVQGINRMLVYVQVWEFQQKMPLREQYKKRDENLIAEWQKKS